MPQLTVNELGSGYTHAIKFDWRDLQSTGWLSTIGAANQRKIGTVGPGGIVDRVVVINVDAEAGSSTLTLDVGVTAADPDDFIDNLDVDGLTKAATNTGDVLSTGAYINNTATGVDILMEFNPVDSTGVTALTTGSWVIAWRQLEANQA